MAREEKLVKQKMTCEEKLVKQKMTREEKRRETC